MTACTGAGRRGGVSRGRAVTTAPESARPSGVCTLMTSVAAHSGSAPVRASSARAPPTPRVAHEMRCGRVEGLIPALESSPWAPDSSYDAQHIRADLMGSFRKRLLVLIIGLVIVTQTVTLAAVLASTRRTVEARAAEQLRSGGSLAEQLIGFRAGQLANGVAVLAADFGFREAVASADAPTNLSAARNNAQRIGADMALLLDTHGRGRASTAPGAADSGSPAGLLEDVSSVRDQPDFRVFGAHSYQFFLAPVRTPETIAWVAMGFVADDALAQKIRDLVGSQVAIVTHGYDGVLRVAATLPAGQRASAFSPAGGFPAASDLSHITRLG